MKMRTASLLGVIAVAAAVLLAGCGGDDDTQGRTTRPATTGSRSDDDTSPTTRRPRATTTTVGRSDEHFTRENFETLITDPERYRGATVDIVGQVFGEIERDADGTYWQMFADPASSEWNVVVMWEAGFQVAVDDYVHVIGSVVDVVEGENAFGGTVSAPAIVATSVEHVDATAAATPATRVAPGGSVTQHGLTIAVDEVQYAPDETRVKVTVTNNSGVNASFYSFNAKMVQGTTQYDTEYSFNDYPEVPSDLLPGVVATGWLTFPAMNHEAPSQIVIEASNENYRLDWNPYVFDIPGA